jgi:hypothetical protein
MATRRSPGEGSIYRSPDGTRWIAQLDLGYDVSGKRVRPRRSAKTRQQAQAKLQELKRKHEQGVLHPGRPRARRVSDWLTLGLTGRSGSGTKRAS